MKDHSNELIGVLSVFLILVVLKKEDSYGYRLVREIKELSGIKIFRKEARVYPLLKKMENNGMVRSYWQKTRGRRPTKFYSILPGGEKRLEQNLGEWELIQLVLNRIMKNGLE